MLSAEEIKNNFDTFLKLCGALGDRSESVISMVNHFNETIKNFRNPSPANRITK